MSTGDVVSVDTGDCTDLYYVDTGMFGTDLFGSVYIVDGDRPAIIDTGLGTHYDRILDGLREVGIETTELEVIALTHVHLDHAGGAGYLVEACPNAEVYVHERGARHLIDPERLVAGTKAAVGDQWEYYVDPQPIPAERIIELDDGDTIDLGDRRLHVHYAPGHASHQVVFESPADDAVFTADAAGIYVPPLDRIKQTSPPPEFDLEAVRADIDMIRDIDPSTLLYGHFGPAPTGDKLDEYESVITDWVADVKAKYAEFEDEGTLVEYFVERIDEPLMGVWTPDKARGEVAMDVRGVVTSLESRDS